MAFGGTLVTTAASADPTAAATVVTSIGGTLAARVGAPDATGAAADSGILTTAAPAVNQNPIPSTFFKGRGLWVAGDENLVSIDFFDPDGVAAATGSAVHVFSKSIVSGNLVIGFHNKGAGASGALNIQLSYK